jgi:hypothetical protein
MTELRCIRCPFPALVVFEGNSLCQEHFARLRRNQELLASEESK